MFVPTTLAPRLKTLKAARLGLYKVRPGGSSKSTEQSVCELVEAIGDLLVRHTGATELDSWTRTRSAERNKSSVLDEIAEASDAVVMGIGDCHHGSAMNFTEVWELEARGVPVAYIDTPRRTPRITREGDTFVIDYFRLESRVKR